MVYYKAHSIQFHADANVAAVNLPDNTDRVITHNPTIDSEVTAPNLSPTFISFMARKSLASLGTYALKDALDILGSQGFCIESTTNPGVTWFEQKYDDCGEPVAGAVHRSYLISLGRAVPDFIEVDHQGNAKINYRIIPIYDGTNDVLVKSDTATLPTLTITPARWTIGKLTIAGTVLDRYESWRLDFGNVAEGRSTKSDVDDTFIDHVSNSPTLTVRGVDPTWFTTAVALNGTALAHADTIFYLRKRAQGGTDFVANGTAQHIKFTMFGLGVIDDLVAGGDIKRLSETSLQLTGAVDSAGNNPLVINTASAIT